MAISAEIVCCYMCIWSEPGDVFWFPLGGGVVAWLLCFCVFVFFLLVVTWLRCGWGFEREREIEGRKRNINIFYCIDILF